MIRTLEIIFCHFQAENYFVKVLIQLVWVRNFVIVIKYTGTRIRRISGGVYIGIVPVFSNEGFTQMELKENGIISHDYLITTGLIILLLLLTILTKNNPLPVLFLSSTTD